MNLSTVEALNTWHKKSKNSALFGRWITHAQIDPILKNLPEVFDCNQVGISHKKAPIYKVEFGKGAIQILVWSQMHGNESTGTKAMFDLLRFFEAPGVHTKLAQSILNKCTITYIPILNPDGAENYTRVNAQGIDLNRDAIELKAPESRVLNTILKTLKPSYCFNLHDQRTIFSVGSNNNPASLSFLAPSVYKERSITESRKTTMSLVVAMQKTLSLLIPDQIGRYTDEFYPTATGDTFQKAGYPTVLIEAGHYKDDYQRESVRSFHFIALLAGLEAISTGLSSKTHDYTDYFKIPNNQKGYLDIIYRNVHLSETKEKVDVGVVFKEVLNKGELRFIEEIKEVGDLTFFSANTIIDKNHEIYKNSNDLENLIKK